MSTEFKSTLPPRKRAKTKEEKEQRRIERILRNRRAAHASREKKRKHVEYLESYVLKLESNLEKAQGNLNRLSELVDSSIFEKAGVVELDDLELLKETIHLNLSNNSGNTSGGSPDVDGDNDEDDETYLKQDDDEDISLSKKRRLDEDIESKPTDSTSTSTATPTATSTVQIVNNVNNNSNFDMNINSQPNNIMMGGKDDLLSVSPDNNSYYNYLSPISMNSPVNSPIDLKLETGAGQQQSLMMESISFTQDPELTKGFNSMGQSSEVILLPRSYDCMMMSISI